MKIPSSTKFIQNLTFAALHALGIFQNDKLKKYKLLHSILHVSLTSIFTLGLLVGFLTRHKTIEKIEVFIFLISQFIHGQLASSSLFLYKDNIANLLAKLKKTYRTDRTDDQPVKGELIRILSALTPQIFIALIPPIFSSFYDNDIRDRYSLVGPMWFSCGDGKTNSILQSICWRVRTKPQLVLSNLIQIITATPSSFVNFGFIILYVIIINDLKKHVDVLREKLALLSAQINAFYSISAQYNRNSPKEKITLLNYEQSIHEKFVQIIKHQQYLKSCIVEFLIPWKTYTSIFASGNLIVGAILVFAMEIEIKEDAILAFRALSYAMTISSIFALMCKYGQILSELNGNVFNDMCDIPWYQQNIKFRKTYAIALCLNQKSIPIKILGIYELGLGSMIVFMKSVYSSFNLIHQTNKK